MADSVKIEDEVDAMRSVSRALEQLATDEERGRVLRWACERFGVSALPRASAARIGAPNITPPDESESEDLGDFYSRAAPSSDMERALVVAYYVQEVRGEGEFDSQTVNTELKHLGHAIGNITRAFDNLKARKPQLVIQIQKSGKAKQARKRYKMTAAGKAEVRRMLSGVGEGEQ